MAKIEFGGQIGDDWRTSEPWWPPLPAPPDGAPNVVLIVLDDVGFAQLGCYGSDIDTPIIDGVAEDGIRLANFHTTALCSPTRACLLTGRNHHRSGMGRVADLAIGFPGYWGRPPRENGFLSETLRANGYATYAVGKWHLSPEGETDMATSRLTWPLGRGFDRWYGFHGGETHQFTPALFHDNHSVRPGRPVEAGYHLSADLADRAIEFLGDLRAVDAELPFFLYFATGACHSPHHAPKEWIERYAGHFAQGWDSWRERPSPVSTPSASSVRALSSHPVRPGSRAGRASTSANERLRNGSWSASPPTSPTRTIRSAACSISSPMSGDADDTVVIVVSDNGASSEGGRDGTINEGRLSNFESSGVDEMYRRIDEIGGPLSHNNYPWGWTMAGNTPFKRWKREVHEGGVADPCIVRVPAARRSGAGEVRRQYAHAIDILPTVLELVGVDPPPSSTGSPSRTSTAPASPTCSMNGCGRARPAPHAALRDARVACDVSRRLEGGDLPPGRAGLRRWSAGSAQPSTTTSGSSTTWPRTCPRSTTWPPNSPMKVAELVSLWWEEARRNDVLPLDNRVLEAVAHKHDRRRSQQTYRYFQGGAPVPEWVAADVRNRSHQMYVTVEVPDDVVPSGVLLALGCAIGGWSLHLLGGRLRYVHNLHGRRLYAVTADSVLGSGRHHLEFRFDKDEGSSVDGPPSSWTDASLGMP